MQNFIVIPYKNNNSHIVIIYFYMCYFSCNTIHAVIIIIVYNYLWFFQINCVAVNYQINNLHLITLPNPKLFTCFQTKY